MPLREAIPDDAAAIARVKIASWRLAYRGQIAQEGLDAMDHEQITARWHEILTEPDHTTLIHEPAGDGAVADGFVSIGPARDADAAQAPAAGEIYAIYVDPPAWGTGVGRVMCTAALDRLATLGFGVVTLWVIAGNTRARRFYERAGFEPDGTSRTETIFGATIDEVRYRRASGGRERSP